MTSQKKPTKETYENWHQASNNWKFGVFYFNKEDKRIFLPKRYKFLGWTVNFANPISIILMTAIAITTFLLFRYLK